MKYFLDTEFIEGFHKPFFGKRRHFIDLISIGIVCEDGREYYAISNEFNPKDASDWVRENVISSLPEKIFNGSNISEAKLWKSNSTIAHDIINFCGATHFVEVPDVTQQSEFYGYYSDYDWVLFCSLFGTMMDLPKGFPMYCIDLKQMLDEKSKSINQLELTNIIVKYPNWEVKGELPVTITDIGTWSKEQKLQLLKSHKDYPKQTNEHNALADAKWNYELYKFIQSI